MKKIIIGICAMEKKSKSQPMNEILQRLEEFGNLKTLVFSEKTILYEPIENWPICDCLISFHSRGFPLEKAKNYSKMRNTMLVNDLECQDILQDRRKVYELLVEEDIDIPRYVVANSNQLQEFDDHITIRDVDIRKPFVEKPVSAEDHNVYIYFPSSAGGGCQRLFRKIGNKSSVYCSESTIRRGGDFIYEEFLPTDGTDVKVYTVGPDYAHAEARKSPGLDGNVCRDAAGKEVRYPIILSPAEKLISRKICLAFRQTVCGFDLLRANGKSYVCDVNGFSFVKNSKRYYHDASRVLAGIVLRYFDMPLELPGTASMTFVPLHPPLVITPSAQIMELRCVIAVVRHGDRTPKQKMKIKVQHSGFFELFKRYGGKENKEVKLKTPKQLQDVLDLIHDLLKTDLPSEEREKFEQIKFVLEMNGSFSGINRKVQLKSHGLEWLDLAVKWGGELTSIGKKEAEELGRRFRYLYPDGVSENCEQRGMGLLRLHATFRHDLKIYASDEGRVQMTAAAFAKGLLALEGELPPILVQMVKSAHTEGLLNENRATKIQSAVKEKIRNLLQREVLTEESKRLLNPCGSISIAKSLEKIKNPLQWCQRMADLMDQLLSLIDQMKNDSSALYHGETWEFLHCRWKKHLRDFRLPQGSFDTSKVPDIYDSIKYDLLHNFNSIFFEGIEELYRKARSLADIVIPQEYGLTIDEKLRIGRNICSPLLKKIQMDLQRNVDEVVHHLDEHYNDTILTPSRHVRTRLYFTSESHLHSLLTVLRFGGLCNSERWNSALQYLSAIPELDYLTQIVIMLYEDPREDLTSPERFRVALHFSPGNKRPIDDDHFHFLNSPCQGEASSADPKDETENDINVYPLKTLIVGLSLTDVDSYLNNVINNDVTNFGTHIKKY